MKVVLWEVGVLDVLNNATAHQMEEEESVILLLAFVNVLLDGWDEIVNLV